MRRLAMIGSRSLHGIIAACGLLAAAASVVMAQDEARTIAFPGGEVHVWDAPGPLGDDQPHYAIRFDGRGFSEARATSYEIKLRQGRFDPLEAALSVDERFASGPDTNLYVVQFVTQPLEGYRAAIRERGGEVHAFLANHAHVVRMDAEAREAVEMLPFVRWVGDFHPAYRMEEFLLDAADAPKAVGVGRYHVMLWDSALVAKQDIAKRIEAIRGRVDLVNAGKFLVRADLSLEQVYEIARWDEVAFIDRWTPLAGQLMDIAREIGGANYIENIDTLHFTGAGVRGEVLDHGFNLAHVDFQSRPLIVHTPVILGVHGAATSGIVFGDGTGNPSARGLLPEGQGIVAGHEVFDEGGQSRYDHTGELVESPYFAVFQSVSIFSTGGISPDYTTLSADIDAAIFDFDIVICQSHGNSGLDGVGEIISPPRATDQAWAKNTISCGGVRHHNTPSKLDDLWSNGVSAASTGPASDGRIKPTLTHFYDATQTVGCCDTDSYTEFGGTSGATPIIAGHVGLFFQMWHEGVFGNPVDPDGTVFDNRSHMTTCKAMLVNTAEQYDWTIGGPNSELTRFRQGWGMPNLRTMYDTRNQALIIDESDLLQNTESNAYEVIVDGEPYLKATLVYADPPGMPFSSQHRINDLSLKVTDPSGVVYWGNNGLIEGLWSEPGGVPNEIDTVENVFVQAPASGTWIVEVIAHEINEDGHVETPELDADYALVVTRGVAPQLTFSFPNGRPELVNPFGGTTIPVRVVPDAGVPDPETARLHLRVDGADYFAVPMQEVAENDFEAVFPAIECGALVEYYFSIETTSGVEVASPITAPNFGYLAEAFTGTGTAFSDDFEQDLGWEVTSDPGVSGAWERGVPQGGPGAPTEDADGSGQCYLTGDVDGGNTWLSSPVLGTTSPESVLVFDYWFYDANSPGDTFSVFVSDDGGATWVYSGFVVVNGLGGWVHQELSVSTFPIALTDQFRVQFRVGDQGAPNVVVAAVDAVELRGAFVCDSCPADVAPSGGDNAVDVADLLFILSHWGPCGSPCPADIAPPTGDGTVDVTDLLFILSNWGACP